jgi:superfamily I DNA/RNA helicase
MLPWASLTAPQPPQKETPFSDRGEGEKVFFYEARDDYGEASFVVDTIAQLVASGDFEPAIVR